MAGSPDLGSYNWQRAENAQNLRRIMDTQRRQSHLRELFGEPQLASESGAAPTGGESGGDRDGDHNETDTGDDDDNDDDDDDDDVNYNSRIIQAHYVARE